MKYQSLLVCIALLLFGFIAHAQTGTLEGKVIDQAEKLSLPGATVVVGDKQFTTVTNSIGDFAITNIPAGTYEVTVTYIGYAAIKQTVTITADATSSVRFEMISGVTLPDGVLILGDRLRGQARALNQQKTNANITNIVASDQIGRFPDANIGDALKRIPGITMQNDQGEARDIIIRGMAPQLNSVTINGERIPSAEGDNRNIQMDLIPADMIQTIEVNKAVLPDMDADAIGGSVNLVTRSAPNSLRVSGTAGTGINLLTDKPIWTGGLIFGNRFANDKLGLIVSASYNNHDFGSDNVEAVWYNSDNGVAIEEFDIRKYLVQRVRRSISLSTDYKINENHTLFLSGIYNHRDDWENRFRMRVGRLDDSFDDGDFTETSPNVFQTKGRVQFQTKGGSDDNRINNRRLEDQRVYNATLGGNHLFNNLRMKWNATYARASEERPMERYLSYRSSNRDVTVDLSNPEFPLSLLSNPQDNFGIGFHEISEENQFTFDRDLNARMDFTLPYQGNGIIKFGLRYRGKRKERQNNFFEFEPVDEDAFGSSLGAVPNENYTDPNYLAGSQYQAGFFASPEFLGGLNLQNRGLFDAKDLPEEYVPGNYTANENISAAYVMADHQFSRKFSAIAGLRVENTSIQYTGNIFNIDEETITSTTGDQNYTNVMPGIHLKFDPKDETVLRFAWTNTIARPNYFDLVPYAEFSPDDEELARGNPNLRPTTSMNFDFMAEKYFSTVGILSAGAFYKNIDDFIYTITTQGYSDPVFGSNLEFSRPENGGTASVYGLEASFQRQIWKGLGIYLNYTFTQSSTSGIEGRENDELVLPGTAENMFNASLSYENERLVLRVSLNYASDYLDELGGEGFEDRFYDRQTFLDANASYAITPKWRIFAEGNNLTNQPLRFYQGIRSRTMQMEYYNARFNLGLKFDLFRD